MAKAAKNIQVRRENRQELTDDEEMSQCKIDNFGYRFFSTDFITRSIRSQLLYDMSFTDDWINMFSYSQS